MTLSRQLTLNTAAEVGDHVVYIMSRDQRVDDNHALIAAQRKADSLSLPLVVVFNLLANPGERALEHASFMLDGLKEVANRLSGLSIAFILTADTSEHELISTLQQLKPAALYFDFSPLPSRRAQAKALAHQFNVSSFVIDTHNIIPAWRASDKQEFAAHTFRNKVHRLLADYLVEPAKIHSHGQSSTNLPPGLSLDDARAFIDSVYPKRNISITFEAGEKAAHEQLKDFLNDDLSTYARSRNNIAIEGQTQLSPYLHFGQLSSLRVALETLYAADARPLLFDQARMASPGDDSSKVDGMNALFEEMIVRKELSDNFCFYSKQYKDLTAAPEWAQKTLAEHADDPRQFQYSFEELESAKTHDAYWNAAQHELTSVGKIHGYMRMYWAKKILEWTKTAEEALDFAIKLNDRYSIDGGDPNGYVGVLWSIGGLHDRPWTERPIFGKVRYMNDLGLKRKFDVDAYVKRVYESE